MWLAALDAGQISLAHARIVMTFRTDLPGTVDAEHGDAVEEFLVARATEFNPTQLQHVAQRLMDTLNPDGKYTDEADQERRRGFTLSENKDGSSTPTGRFTPELTAIQRPVLDCLSMPQPAEGLPDTRTPAQRRRDACRRGRDAATALRHAARDRWLPGHRPGPRQRRRREESRSR